MRARLIYFREEWRKEAVTSAYDSEIHAESFSDLVMTLLM